MGKRDKIILGDEHSLELGPAEDRRIIAVREEEGYKGGGEG